MDEFQGLLSAEPQTDLRKQRFHEIETFIHSNERMIHEEQRAPGDLLGDPPAEPAAPGS